jgi:hypothetical protein
VRSRNIKPAFFINSELAECDFASRLLFIGLWCYADREGRFEWKPKQIRAAIFPYDSVDIDQLLCNLMSLHLITCHDMVGHIPCFKKHQHPHPHEPKSTLPENPNKNNVIACNTNVMTCQEDLGLRIEDIRIVKPSCGVNPLESEKPKVKQPEKKFVPPAVEEVAAYCAERGNGLDPVAFWNFYESKGWMIGKNKMKAWKSAIVTWETKHPVVKVVSPAAMPLTAKELAQQEATRKQLAQYAN